MEPHMYDDLMMTKNYQELDGATGMIEAGAEQQERLEEFTERVGSGEFHVSTEKTSLCKCIDGRSCQHALTGPNSAGGSLSYVVADDLTTKRFAGMDFAATIDNTFEVLRGQDQEIGVHNDTHAAGEKSGCGANDRLPEIYAKIAGDGGAIRDTAEAILGGTIDETTHELIVASASARSDFDTGAATLETMRRDGAAVETLEGDHNEVAAIINLRKGTTLDRAALNAEFGDTYQAFNVDAWAFQEAAETTSLSEDEATQKLTALTYYNIATALVLCGPKMRVIVAS